MKPKNKDIKNGDGSPADGPRPYVLLGIGNRLRGDDGAGGVLAERFSAPGWVSMDCGSMPENFTGPVRKINPRFLVIVDACDMELAPGEFRRLDPAGIERHQGFNTHRPPMAMLLERLRESAGEIVWIGIQPLSLEFGEGLSAPVEEAIGALGKLLARDNWESILPFHS